MQPGKKCPREVRERGVRLVLEARVQDPDLSANAAYVRIGNRLGLSKDTLRSWVRQHEIDTGDRAGVTTEDNQRIKVLEKEVKELKRANEILLAASSFFARELDPRLPF